MSIERAFCYAALHKSLSCPTLETLPLLASHRINLAHGPSNFLHLVDACLIESFGRLTSRTMGNRVRTMHEITSRFVAQLHGIFGCSSFVESST